MMHHGNWYLIAECWFTIVIIFDVFSKCFSTTNSFTVDELINESNEKRVSEFKVRILSSVSEVK